MLQTERASLYNLPDGRRGHEYETSSDWRSSWYTTQFNKVDESQLAGDSLQKLQTRRVAVAVVTFANGASPPAQGVLKLCRLH